MNIDTYLQDAEPIDMGSLSTRTRKNLEKLEEKGFSWHRAYKAYGGPGKTGPSRVAIFSPDVSDAVENYSKAEDIFDEYSQSVVGFRSVTPKRAPDRYSYFIEGQGPEGEEVLYVRRETNSSAAGQTYLITPYGRIQVSALLSSEEIKKYHKKEDNTSKAFNKYIWG